MNIWFINHYASEPELGGCLRYHNWGRQLIKKGHTVTIFAASSFHGGYNKNLVKGKLPFVESSVDGINYVYLKVIDYNCKIKRVFNMFQFHFKMMKTHRKFSKPDIIVARTPNPLSIISAKKISHKYGISYICDVVDLWPQSAVEHLHINPKNPAIILAYAFEKWMYTNSDAIIFSMEGGYEYIKDKKWTKKIPQKKVFHINMGLDLDLFQENLERNSIDKSNMERKDIFKVVYCGSVRTANNVKMICDTAKEIKFRGKSKIRFFIHGSGDQVEVLRRYCELNEIDNIEFYGRISKQQIPFLITNSDLNLLNYQNVDLFKYGVSFNKMFDYFAGGNPILGNCDFGYNLIDRYQCGKIITNASVEEYADGIIDFFDMGIEERSKFGINGQKAAKDFSQPVLAHELYKVFDFLNLQ